jgi:hypothetical protein
MFQARCSCRCLPEVSSSPLLRLLIPGTDTRSLIGRQSDNLLVGRGKERLRRSDEAEAVAEAEAEAEAAPDRISSSFSNKTLAIWCVLEAIPVEGSGLKPVLQSRDPIGPPQLHRADCLSGNDLKVLHFESW